MTSLRDEYPEQFKGPYYLVMSVIAGLLPDEGFLVYKQEYGEIREVDDYPEVFLKRRATEFMKMVATLRGML